MARPKGSTNKAKAPVIEAVEAVDQSGNPAPEPSDPVKLKGGVTITERYDEPRRGNVWDVSYGNLTDKGFLTLEAAQKHADAMAKA
jgi:hypothetical protein